jgi:hypothetical protein
LKILSIEPKTSRNGQKLYECEIEAQIPISRHNDSDFVYFYKLEYTNRINVVEEIYENLFIEKRNIRYLDNNNALKKLRKREQELHYRRGYLAHTYQNAIETIEQIDGLVLFGEVFCYNNSQVSQKLQDLKYNVIESILPINYLNTDQNSNYLDWVLKTFAGVDVCLCQDDFEYRKCFEIVIYCNF